MKFKFQIKELPKGSESYRKATDIEGNLSIVIRNNEILFDADGILLVEFAIFCKKWLDENIVKDFYYASMDFEEEPIIAFDVQQSDTCRFHSVWQKFQTGDIPLDEVRESMKNYIENLKINLNKNFRIKIEGYEDL